MVGQGPDSFPKETNDLAIVSFLSLEHFDTNIRFPLLQLFQHLTLHQLLI